ncbi:hypothetical protein HID58_059834 [Brassica napus]|uniref:Uncharacterized protein n=1 Tax=Brassica napus TaxID=3708 RepID=A0ABQ7ZUB4_BRANA|nr:hypothetical protein HID58_059834 [Brassica napus]
MSNHVLVCHLDLCGALVHVGPLEDLIQVQPNQFYEINCAAYGTVAEKLYENWFSSTAKVVVCVLQLWQIEWGEGCLSYITNFEECLDNLFDPRIP